MSADNLQSLAIVDERAGIEKDEIAGFELVRKGKDDDRSTAFHEHLRRERSNPSGKNFGRLIFAIAVPHFAVEKETEKGSTSFAGSSSGDGSANTAGVGDGKKAWTPAKHC